MNASSLYFPCYLEDFVNTPRVGESRTCKNNPRTTTPAPEGRLPDFNHTLAENLVIIRTELRLHPLFVKKKGKKKIQEPPLAVRTNVKTTTSDLISHGTTIADGTGAPRLRNSTY